MAVILVLCLASIVLCAAFEQAPTSLNLFARDFTARNVFGWEMPTLWLQSANSFFVSTPATVLGPRWVGLVATLVAPIASTPPSARTPAPQPTGRSEAPAC